MWEVVRLIKIQMECTKKETERFLVSIFQHSPADRSAPSRTLCKLFQKNALASAEIDGCCFFVASMPNSNQKKESHSDLFAYFSFCCNQIERIEQTISFQVCWYSLSDVFACLMRSYFRPKWCLEACSRSQLDALDGIPIQLKIMMRAVMMFNWIVKIEM